MGTHADGDIRRRRVPSTRTGTGIPSPYAQVVPVRKRSHPAARNVPVDVAGRGLQPGLATLVYTVMSGRPGWITLRSSGSEVTTVCPCSCANRAT